MFRAILFFVLTFSVTAKATGIRQGYLQPVQLSNTFYSQISQDFPIKDILFNEQKEILWLLGQKYLWRWNIGLQLLSRTSLTNSDSVAQSLKTLGTDGLTVFIASDKSLYQIQEAPFRVFQYDHPKKSGETLGFAHMQDLFGWLHTSGSYFVDRYSKNLVSHIEAMDLLKPKDIVHYHQHSNTIWYSRFKNMYVYDLKTNEESFLRTANLPLIGVNSTKNDIFFFSSRNIYKLSAKHRAANQIIPVANSNSILAASHNESDHLYLFDNGTLERYKLTTEESTHYRLPITNLGSNVKMLQLNKLIAILYNGKFLVFKATE